jgi:2-haloacid dehalogenase
MTVLGVVFDGYGTLFDLRSTVEAAQAIAPDPEALSALWRRKQLEYTWVRSLMGRWRDFWEVTDDALRFAVRQLGLGATEDGLVNVRDAYLTLPLFPEVKVALD